MIRTNRRHSIERLGNFGVSRRAKIFRTVGDVLEENLQLTFITNNISALWESVRNNEGDIEGLQAVDAQTDQSISTLQTENIERKNEIIEMRDETD